MKSRRKKDISIIRSTILSISFIFLIVFLTGCKKYDEGPFLTFRSPESRLHGVWDVQYIYVNDIDSTFYLKSHPCWTPMEFLEKDIIGTNLVSAQPGHNGCFLYGKWGLDNFNEDLELLFTGRGWPIIGLWGYENKAVDWKINRLTSSELWIEANANNVYTWVHLEKQ